MKRYECEECGEEFDSRSRYDLHSAGHLLEKEGATQKDLLEVVRIMLEHINDIEDDMEHLQRWLSENRDIAYPYYE